MDDPNPQQGFTFWSHFLLESVEFVPKELRNEPKTIKLWSIRQLKLLLVCNLQGKPRVCLLSLLCTSNPSLAKYTIMTIVTIHRHLTCIVLAVLAVCCFKALVFSVCFDILAQIPQTPEVIDFKRWSPAVGWDNVHTLKWRRYIKNHRQMLLSGAS